MAQQLASIKIPTSTHSQVVNYLNEIGGGEIRQFVVEAIEEKLQAIRENQVKQTIGVELSSQIAQIGGQVERMEKVLNSLGGTVGAGTDGGVDLSAVESRVLALMEIIGIPIMSTFEMLAEATQQASGEALARVKGEFMERGRNAYLSRYRDHLQQRSTGTRYKVVRK